MESYTYQTCCRRIRKMFHSIHPPRPTRDAVGLVSKNSLRKMINFLLINKFMTILQPLFPQFFCSFFRLFARFADRDKIDSIFTRHKIVFESPLLATRLRAYSIDPLTLSVPIRISPQMMNVRS